MWVQQSRKEIIIHAYDKRVYNNLIVTVVLYF